MARLVFLLLLLARGSIQQNIDAQDKKVGPVGATGVVDSCQQLRTVVTSEFATIKAEMALISSEVTSVKARGEETRKVLQSLLCFQSQGKLAALQLTRLSSGAYLYHTERMPQAEAGAWCKAQGMRLAQLETLEEVKVVLQNAPNEWFWLGGSDVGLAPGDFRWSDGGKVAKELWNVNQPETFAEGKETCVCFYPSFGKLDDMGCASSIRPLCELPPELLSCL